MTNNRTYAANDQLTVYRTDYQHSRSSFHT